MVTRLFLWIFSVIQAITEFLKHLGIQMEKCVNSLDFSMTFMTLIGKLNKIYELAGRRKFCLFWQNSVALHNPCLKVTFIPALSQQKKRTFYHRFIMCLWDSMQITCLGACKAENTHDCVSSCTIIFISFTTLLWLLYYRLFCTVWPWISNENYLTAILPLFSAPDNQNSADKLFISLPLSAV